jgi:hypothetical protein
MAHEWGPDSNRVAKCAERIFKHFDSLLAALPPSSLLMVTADHGQTAVNPAKTVYLDKLIPKLRTAIETGEAGLPLVPAGSARDFFLHIKQEHREELRGEITTELAGVAEVYPISELIKIGVFGNAPSERLLQRLGDTVVLPLPGETVWWSENDKFKMPFLGHHGGLSDDEALIPLISFRT